MSELPLRRRFLYERWLRKPQRGRLNSGLPACSLVVGLRTKEEISCTSLIFALFSVKHIGENARCMVLLYIGRVFQTAK